MSFVTSKARAVWHFATTLKPLIAVTIGAGLVLVGSGLLIVSAQHPKTAVADDKKLTPSVRAADSDVTVAQVQGAETTAPQSAEQSTPAAVSTPKPTTKQSTPVTPADKPATPVVDRPIIKPVQPPISFSVNGPTTISVARGSSATLTYYVVGGASANWQGFFKNTIYSNGDNESPSAPYHMVVPFSGSYSASSVTFTVTVEATATPGSNNEVALHVTSEQGLSMTMTTKLTIL
jgi:hypothetical protein